jgi:hypothetical protein
MRSSVPKRSLKIKKIKNVNDKQISPRSVKPTEWNEERCECSPDEIDEEDVGNIDQQISNYTKFSKINHIKQVC